MRTEKLEVHKRSRRPPIRAEWKTHLTYIHTYIYTFLWIVSYICVYLCMYVCAYHFVNDHFQLVVEAHFILSGTRSRDPYRIAYCRCSHTTTYIHI